MTDIVLTAEQEKEIDVNLLRDVADMIEANPEDFCQYSFGKRTLRAEKMIAKDIRFIGDSFEGDVFNYNPCNTYSCVAGHIALIRNYDHNGREKLLNFANKQLFGKFPARSSIFNATWPGRWYSGAGYSDSRSFDLPPAEEAIVILRWLADNPAELFHA